MSPRLSPRNGIRAAKYATFEFLNVQIYVLGLERLPQLSKVVRGPHI